MNTSTELITAYTPMECCNLCLGMGVQYYYPMRTIHGRRQQVIRGRNCHRCDGLSQVPAGSRNP